MSNWRTTAAGVISALGIILPMFGIPAPVGEALKIIGLFALGFFAKDHAVSGTGV